MLSNLAQFGLDSIGGWLVVAVAAVFIIFIVLKIVGKAISASIRLAIILGTLVVIAIALLVLSTFLNNTGLSFP